MAIVFTIGGVDRTQLIQPGSIALSDEMNGRNSLRFQLKDPSAVVHPDPGTAIVVTEGATTLFAGTVESPEETLLEGGLVLIGDITAVDYNQLPDRFLVAEVYEGVSTQAIAADLVTKYLAADGVTVGTVDAGPVISRKVFRYVPLTEALDWLTEQTGLPWQITYGKVFHLRAPGSMLAPFAANNSTCRSIRVSKPRGNYRNRQYIRGGRDLTDPRPDSFKGDGVRRTFNTAFPVGKVPTVTVNAIGKTVGIRGVETGKDWYWSKDTNEISQDDAATILTTSDTLIVTYQGLFPILVQAQLDAAIADRVAVEGGSGVYEAIEDHPEIDDADLAIDSAAAKLAREGAIRRVVDIVTDQVGLASGQLITVTESKLGLSGTFLVQSVSARDLGVNWLRYSATLLSGGGDAAQTWLDFYKRLMQAKRRNELENDQESLQLARTFADAVACSDASSAVTGSPETRIGFATIGYGEIG